jgi:hypothetical protein
MKEVTLDADTIAQLNDGQEQLKLRDESGRVLGYFWPAQSRGNEVIFGVKSPFSREELERRYQEGKDTAKPLKEWFAEMNKKYPGQFPWDSP